MKPLPVSRFTVTSALGRGLDAHARALREGRTGLKAGRFPNQTFDAWIGAVEGLDAVTPPPALPDWDARAHRLAWLALQQDGLFEAVLAARERYGAARIGVFIGTSTSGIADTEAAFRARDAAGALPAAYSYVRSQNLFSVAEFARAACGLQGPALVISTACSSSAKVFASARRAIAQGWCDAALVGGVDTLCLTTLQGFHALQLVSPDICRPADAERRGISVGEAAGFALLDPGAEPDLLLLGCGESSDAHHMSTPEPEGRGAALAMQAALRDGGLEPEAIDYVNLHGTGTPANDRAEDRAVCAVFGERTPCSSTKGWTGHTLGAAGIVEAAISLLAIRHGHRPASLNLRRRDPELRAAILEAGEDAPVRRVLSNSFGFGGSNCALLFGAAA